MQNADIGSEEGVRRLADIITESDAVLVGAASGMSAAAGYTFYYEHDSMFEDNFHEFEDKYGYTSGFDGFYYNYRTDAERWAFISKMMCLILDEGASQPYLDIKKVLNGKEYHILTTNQDQQFNRVFPEENISAIQGDWGYIQCSRPCHDGLYPSGEIAHMLRDSIDKDLRVPEDMIPRCPRCGATMEPWVRSRVFLEGSRYREEYRKLNNFIMSHKDERILFLEIGVGRMTPMFIQEPFWNLTYNLTNSRYVTINPNHAIVPDVLSSRGFAIRDDVAKVLRKLVRLGGDEIDG